MGPVLILALLLQLQNMYWMTQQLFYCVKRPLKKQIKYNAIYDNVFKMLRLGLYQFMNWIAWLMFISRCKSEVFEVITFSDKVFKRIKNMADEYHVFCSS